jgi:hypothetical protein
MSTTWTVAEFVDELKLQLDALPAITALDPPVEIRVSIPHAAEDISDIIALGIDATDIKEQVSLGAHTHDEQPIVGCMAAVIRYGSGDADAKIARDRAMLLASIVDEEIRENAPEVGTQTIWARVSARELETFPSIVDEDVPVRVARVRFDIEYRARTNP